MKHIKIGRFRLNGKIHYWMYDRFSLKLLLEKHAFKDITIENPHDSRIENWNSYELDVKGYAIFDPTSLFIEATK